MSSTSTYNYAHYQQQQPYTQAPQYQHQQPWHLPPKATHLNPTTYTTTKNPESASRYYLPGSNNINTGPLPSPAPTTRSTISTGGQTYSLPLSSSSSSSSSASSSPTSSYYNPTPPPRYHTDDDNDRSAALLASKSLELAALTSLATARLSRAKTSFEDGIEAARETRAELEWCAERVGGIRGRVSGAGSGDYGGAAGGGAGGRGAVRAVYGVVERRVGRVVDDE
ncbi:hypothetical protein AAFC00_001161 [Neodothiora populina]|uniref:KxDL domain-containing protein n=1 Tax=Neodothiora populina TaxID=2781224 RepID=A0ABR3PN08_9PEZI